MSNGEGSASKVNTFSSWYDSGFFLSFMTLGFIRKVGVVGVVGVVGSVVRDSDVRGRQTICDPLSINHPFTANIEFTVRGFKVQWLLSEY